MGGSDIPDVSAPNVCASDGEDTGTDHMVVVVMLVLAGGVPRPTADLHE